MNNIKRPLPKVETYKGNDIRVFALGGLDEVGKNMYVVETKKEIIVIDSGIMFPDSGYGVDYIIPDYTYLKKNEEKSLAFLSHTVMKTILVVFLISYEWLISLRFMLLE